MAQQRTREELLELFEEQIEFLEWSNAAFDDGRLAEAKRLSLPLRVLFHHTTRSHALLNQLGLNKTLTWVDSAGMPDPRNLLPEWGLVQAGIHIEDGKGTASYRAPLGDRPQTRIRTKSLLVPCGSRIPLDEWWTEPVVKDADGTLFSRKDFIMALANKEGGAHVDPEILESYNKIANLNSLGWTYSEGPEGKQLTSTPIAVSQSGQPAQATSNPPAQPSKLPEFGEDWTGPIPLDNPVPYMLRQISYEVVESVRQQRDRIK
ncbi:MAG: hypothetical protein QOE61_6673 [Micromonosporaceae bacterium]|nr:hypothetical protein [Micromonosporaceae bacterium]